MADNVEDDVWLHWLRQMDRKLGCALEILDDMTRRMRMNTYDIDIIAWANEQARLLRERHFDQLDIEHIAEEIESVAWASSTSLPRTCPT
jgi:hypothetical protein